MLYKGTASVCKSLEAAKTLWFGSTNGPSKISNGSKYTSVFQEPVNIAVNMHKNLLLAVHT